MTMIFADQFEALKAMMIEVNDLKGNRFDVALKIFEGGETFVFNGSEFWLDPLNSVLHIRIAVTWSRITDKMEEAIVEFQRASHSLTYLVTNSPTFAKIIEGFSPRFALIEDYGTGAVEICYLANDKIVWR